MRKPKLVSVSTTKPYLAFLSPAGMALWRGGLGPLGRVGEFTGGGAFRTVVYSTT